jgi:hypothetical protein
MSARVASLRSWANTPDRTARTRNGRAASPSNVEWHIARLDADRFADATDAQRRAAGECARQAYFAELAAKSAASRRRGAA